MAPLIIIRCIGLLLVVEVTLSFGQDFREISSIYDGVIEAVESKGVSKSWQIMKEHFFTKNENDSVWKLALDDTWKILHREFERSEHVTFEKDLFKLEKIWNSCIKTSTKDREDCREEVFTRTKSYMKDFQWEGSVATFTEKNYISIRVAYQALEILMWKILAEDPLISQKKEVLEWYDRIKSEYTYAIQYLIAYTNKMRDEKPYDLSVVEVCEVKQILWQEFEQPACEKRSRKNLEDIENTADEDDDDDDDDVKDRRKREAGTPIVALENDVDEEESDANSGDDESVEDNDNYSGVEESENITETEFYKLFTPDFSKVERIGGITSDYKSIMDGRFTDNDGGNVIHVGQRISDLHNSAKGVAVEELVNIGYNKREKYEQKITREISVYLSQTFGKVHKAGEILMRQLQKLRKKTIQKRR